MKQICFEKLDTERIEQNSKDMIKNFKEEKRINWECAADIESLIDQNFDGRHLNTETVLNGLLQKYTPERIAYILAVRTYDNDSFDQRITKDTEDWAKKILEDVPDLYKNKKDHSVLHSDLKTYLSVHPLLLNGIVKAFKEAFPELHITSCAKPLTAFIKVESYVGFEENTEKDHIVFKLKTTDSGALLRLTSRIGKESSSILATMAVPAKEVNDSLYAVLYENGELSLQAAGTSVVLSHEEFKKLVNVLNAYTRDEYDCSIESIMDRVTGQKSPEKTEKVLTETHVPEKYMDSVSDIYGYLYENTCGGGYDEANQAMDGLTEEGYNIEDGIVGLLQTCFDVEGYKDTIDRFSEVEIIPYFVSAIADELGEDSIKLIRDYTVVQQYEVSYRGETHTFVSGAEEIMDIKQDAARQIFIDVKEELTLSKAKDYSEIIAETAKVFLNTNADVCIVQHYRHCQSNMYVDLNTKGQVPIKTLQDVIDCISETYPALSCELNNILRGADKDTAKNIPFEAVFNRMSIENNANQKKTSRKQEIEK